jgi:pimeloyl-ACP methyl ester carboxylesterase
MEAAQHRTRRRLGVLLGLGMVATLLALSVSQVQTARALATALTRPYRASFGARPQDLAPSYQDVSFPSRTDHLTLRGWLLHSASPTGRSVVLLHGSNADRAIDARLARDLVGAGYDVLLFDFRACGTSDGDHQTFGNLEQRDVLGAHDLMVARGYSPSLMTFLGNSTGATALLGAAPQMPDVAAIVSDSAFNSAARQFSTFWSDAGVSRPLVWMATQVTRADGADPYALATDAVRSMPGRAILFIHARGDQRIAFADAQALRAASADPHSELWISEATSHDGTYGFNPRQYLQRVLGFVDQQMAAARPPPRRPR